MKRIHCANEDGTRALASEIGKAVRPGDRIALEGPLGAGKSVFARALIRHLTADPDLEVPSPTFALVQPYETQMGAVLHADLYRLADAGEADELALFDDAGAILIVEWPDRMTGLADQAEWRVLFTPGVGEEDRDITLSGTGPHRPEFDPGEPIREAS